MYCIASSISKLKKGVKYMGGEANLFSSLIKYRSLYIFVSLLILHPAPWLVE